MKDFLLIFSVAVMLLSGYVIASGETAPQADRSGVFSEVGEGETAPQGYVDLTILAVIKTHPEGYYILESGESAHGSQGYPFQFSIDGQRVTWRVGGVRDVRPDYEKDGGTSRDPEAGEGMRYALEKRVRLLPGPHRLVFSLPGEDYSTEVEIMLREGGKAVVEYRPVYRYKTRPTRVPTFLEGISRYEVFFNGGQVN